MTPFFKKKTTHKESVRQPRLMQGQDEISFRRSRTLTGSKSADVGAANERKAELKSDRLKKHELRGRRRALFVGLLLLLCVIAALYYLISQYIGTIRVTQLLPVQAVINSPSQQQYQTGIIKYLQSHPGERFRFSLNNTKLSEAINKEFPEVERIDSDGGSFGYGNFTVTLRQPVASWKLAEKQYFVDAHGEAFEKNYLNTPDVNVIDNSGASLSKGNAIASQGFLRFLGRLVALVDESGLGRVTEATLPPNTTREVDIRIEGRGYFVKTHTDRDPASEVEDLKRVAKYLEDRKITPQYIDIRVEGRAFYK